MEVSQSTFNWISAVGSILSLIGVLVAIYQIKKTRGAAEAAESAAIDARKELVRSVSIVDIASVTASLNEVKAYLRSGSFESALVRTGDLISRIKQIEARVSENLIKDEDFELTFSQLVILREALERKVNGKQRSIDVSDANRQLDDLADTLNAVIGMNSFRQE